MAQIMKKFIIQSTVELYIGHHILDILPEVCAGLKGRIAIIKDPLIPQQFQGEQIFFELKKTREAKQFLEDQLLKSGFGRDSIFVAVGGGTTTDLVGFVASTYMRGVPLILVPTTLLAMVDAAIGGKTAIDTPFGKNLIGSFYLPKAILIDLDFLKTLPESERINGLSEILKIALVYDATILQLPFEEQIIRAILAKVAVVELDPTEKGMRRILNFGHTIAHAIEFCTQYSVAHGEAVALGCLAESYISLLMGLIRQEDFTYIMQLFPKFSWNFDRNELLKAMRLDKKNAQGSIRFVLIDKIGHACECNGDYCREVPEAKIVEALQFMERTYV